MGSCCAGALPIVLLRPPRQRARRSKKPTLPGKVRAAKNRAGTTGQYVGAPDGVDSLSAGKDPQQESKGGAPGDCTSSEWIGGCGTRTRQPVADALGITLPAQVSIQTWVSVKGVNQMASGMPVYGRFPTLWAAAD